jgi:hypothetical protein
MVYTIRPFIVTVWRIFDGIGPPLIVLAALGSAHQIEWHFPVTSNGIDIDPLQYYFQRRVIESTPKQIR